MKMGMTISRKGWINGMPWRGIRSVKKNKRRGRNMRCQLLNESRIDDEGGK